VSDYEELSSRHSARYGELFGEYLAHHLTGAGVVQPEVSVSTVEAIERTAAGKHRRFVPMA
jgi:hypothetical protein